MRLLTLQSAYRIGNDYPTLHGVCRPRIREPVGGVNDDTIIKTRESVNFLMQCARSTNNTYSLDMRSSRYGNVFHTTNISFETWTLLFLRNRFAIAWKLNPVPRSQNPCFTMDSIRIVSLLRSLPTHITCDFWELPPMFHCGYKFYFIGSGRPNFRPQCLVRLLSLQLQAVQWFSVVVER